MFPGKTRTSLEVLSTQGIQNDLSKRRSNSTPLLLHYFMLNEEGEKDPAAASFPDVLGWRAVGVELWVLRDCWYRVDV